MINVFLYIGIENKENERLIYVFVFIDIEGNFRGSLYKILL